jgi:acyl-coenzyme A thioesterase PaaI-like protein
MRLVESPLALQDRYAPKNRCFGCGPANEKGLRLKSRVSGDVLLADWTPEPHHEAFQGVLNGGIIGALLDCHSNWAAVFHFMRVRKVDDPPSCVTADFHVKLVRPTATNGPVHLEARVAEANDDRAIVEATMTAAGKVTATCRGTFVAVKEGHPAFGRW